MQAIVLADYGASSNFRRIDLPLPALRPGDVRVKVRSISFNPIDVQIRKGSPPGTAVTAPILGRDLSGTVDAVHHSVTSFQPGDDVYSCVCKLANSGAYAEYVCVPEELVARKPSRLSHDEAAAVPVAGITAGLALEKVGEDSARSLFLLGGAGGVGSFVIAMSKRLGSKRLFTTAGSSASRAYLIGEYGLLPDRVIDYREPDFMSRALAVNGGPFDAAIDLVGGTALSEVCRALAVGGQLASATDAPSHDDFELLFDRNASFHAIGAHAYSLTSDRLQWLKYRELLDKLSDSLDSGSIRLPRVVNVGPLSVETVRRAHDMLERGVVQGKLVMSC